MTESVHHRLDLASGLGWGPWSVQLDANWAEGGALAACERLRRRYGAILGNRLPLVLHVGSAFVVRVSKKSQTDANTLCARVGASGGACIVLDQRAKTVASTFLRASTGGVANLNSHAPKPALPITRRIVVQPSGRPLRRGYQHRRRCKLGVRAAPRLEGLQQHFSVSQELLQDLLGKSQGCPTTVGRCPPTPGKQPAGRIS